MIYTEGQIETAGLFSPGRIVDWWCLRQRSGGLFAVADFRHRVFVRVHHSAAYHSIKT